MTVLCHGNCHVTLTNADACTCGAVASAPWKSPQGGQPYPLSGGVIPGYTPHSFAPPRPPTPPVAGEGPPVNIAQFAAAQRSGGSHLSADGERVYCVRYGQTLEAGWNERKREYGAWGPVAEMPKDAVAM